MDERIRNLKSTTFCGRRLTRRQLSEIQRTAELFPALSQTELAKTVCEHLGWHASKGDARFQTALTVLRRLERFGVLRLPAARKEFARASKAVRRL